ncbi:MAG: thiamine pyrophosphate-dependent dehydrogenase E1 component subunit alpha [bacterium]|nr:thiamine pyrophosphate-dependent dehydrogenase E1 component subunit alpha [bacterium]
MSSLTEKYSLELLRQMKRIRMTEEIIAQRYSEGKMRCPTHLCIGQEAVGAAVGMALRKDDFAVSTHRAHGHYLGKGGDLKKMIAEIYGKATGCSAGKGGSMHLTDRDAGFMGSTAIVGGTIPVGVGLGLSIKLNKTDQVSCVFLGDGSVEEGVFYESVNFAALKKLPVLFVCENNFYSVYSPLKVRQPEGRRIYQMVEAIGIPGEHGNGNDAVEIYSKISSAVDSIRQNKGPCFFEFSTYRWREHCGPNFDNDIGYRTEQEYLAWKEKDPIQLLESQLLDQNIVHATDIEKMEGSIQAEISLAFDYAEESAFPSAEEVVTDLYKD